MQLILTPELLLEAYRQGLFPMAYNAESPHIHWICPEERGQLSITDIHFSKSLLKTVRSEFYNVRIDTAFAETIEACAQTTPSRPETWINEPIKKAFIDLHEQGHAHSVECWQDGQLVGGLYGLAIGGAFFGESMFSRARDASKVALVHLVARLWKGGFTLLDTQFVNDHLKQFGVYEIPFNEYKTRLNDALAVKGDFTLENTPMSEKELVSEYLNMRKGNFK